MTDKPIATATQLGPNRWAFDFDQQLVQLEDGDTLTQAFEDGEWHHTIRKADGTVIPIPTATVFSP